MLSLGSNAQLGIGIALKLHDQFSPGARAANQTLKELQKNSLSAIASQARAYRDGALGVAAGAAAASYGMLEMAKQGANFEHRINQVAIVGGKALGKTRKDLSGYAIEMSREFTRTPEQVAAAMFENTKAGITEGLDLITKYQIAVSTATDEALEGEQGVAAGLLGIMNSMNLSIDQFPRVANAVTMAANSSMASVYSLNESMQYFANTAKVANIPLEETLALIARLSQSNIRGSSAGTALSNMILHATKATGMFAGPKKLKAIQAAGMSQEYIAGLMNDGRWFDLIDYVDQSVKGMDYVTKMGALDQIFGIRGNKALLNLFGDADPNKTLRALLDQTKEGVAGDVAIKQSKAMMNDLAGDFKFFGQAVEEFKIKFTEAAGPVLRIMTKFVTGFVRLGSSILESPFGKVLAGIAVVLAPIVGIIALIRAGTLSLLLAARAFQAQASVGGYGGLIGGLLGGIGNTIPVGKNKAGRPYVKGGHTLTYEGKLYKGGQVLPASYGKSGQVIGGVLAGVGGAAAGYGGKIIGWLGKIGPWIGKIAGLAARFLPAIGIILSMISLFDTAGPVRNPQDEALKYQMYQNAVSSHFRAQDPMYAKLWDERLKKNPVNLNQTINLNVDGKAAMQKTVQQDVYDNIDNQMDYNLMGGY